MNRKVFFCCVGLIYFNLYCCYSQTDDPDLNRIIELRKESRDLSIDLETRMGFAQQASKLSLERGIDTTILLSNRNLAVLYYQSDDFDRYVPQNQENFKLATKVKDTMSLAISTFNLGTYYGYYLPADSAFYYLDKSLYFYEYLDDSYNMGIILFGLANIQANQKDYLAAEENAIKALSLFLELEENKSTLWYIHACYDLLGNITLMANSLDQSIEYFDKALEVVKKIEDPLELQYTKNNKAFTLRRQEKYDESLSLYREVINEPNLFSDDPEFYALLLDNIAFTRFVSGDKDYQNIKKDLFRAYAISDSLDSDHVKLGVTIDLSKVLYAQQKLDSSKVYAKESYELAQKLENNEILLDALLMLGKSTKGEEGEQYFLSHINLSDSLLKIERSARNKFARVKFNTDQIEQENERISRQRQWLLGISGGLLLTSFLIYIIITQRAKNKELQFIQDQQKANEEIYNLMLSQQDKIDEARANEKKRISQEIHDGVLGRMFGVRLSLDSLNFNNGPDAIKNRSQYINELKTIEEDMRKISHELNTDFVSGSGFIDILMELIDKQSTAFKIDYSFDYDEEIHWEIVSNKTKINIYRIIQESLQNIYKHADAEKVWISIVIKNDVICLTIRDDGKGFDVSKSKKGIGIKNINSRIDELGGELKINSILNQGTSLEFEVPYNIKSDAAPSHINGR